MKFFKKNLKIPDVRKSQFVIILLSGKEGGQQGLRKTSVAKKNG